MTLLEIEPPRHVGVRSDSPVEPASAAAIAADVVPAHLLDGGEIVVLAIKPSLWFILLVSKRWIAGAALVLAAASLAGKTALTLPIMQLAVGLLIGRLLWATMQWSTRLYVLTNRRIMLIRGVFNVQLFECALTRLQNTWMTFSLAERILRLGSIHLSTAAGADAGGTATWKTVARPIEVHEHIRAAIGRASSRGNHAL